MTPDPTTYTTLADALVGCTIENGNIQLTKVIAAGAFGAVLLAKQALPYPAHVAVKCIIKPDASATRDLRFLLRELHLHHTTQAHKNVVSLHRWFEEEGYVFIVMDYFKDGDLFGMITDRQMFVAQDAMIKDAMLQVIDGLMHCHSKGVYHRDIKPENILCREDEGGLHLALADFGLATNQVVSQEWGVGSTYYMSPGEYLISFTSPTWGFSF
jgi:serine/threonine protein kinase